jgi:DNA-binding NtrC family response regulator
VRLICWEALIFGSSAQQLAASLPPDQEGEIHRVGADRPIRVNVRLLAATNRDLSAEVAAGRFRADLFHRLNVYPLAVPPLRERGEDIALLAGYFCDTARRRMGVGPVRLDPSAVEALLGYPWPGNVRELENVISRAVLRRDEPDGIPQPAPPSPRERRARAIRRERCGSPPVRINVSESRLSCPSTGATSPPPPARWEWTAGTSTDW